MDEFSKILSRVMMTSVRLPRQEKSKVDSFSRWAEVEYKRDSRYALDCMKTGRHIDLH
jgi:hypothetical protein